MLNKLKNIFNVRIKRADYFVQVSFFTAVYLYLCATFTPESVSVDFVPAQLADFVLLGGYLMGMSYPVVGRLHDIGKSADLYFTFSTACFLSLVMHVFIPSADPGNGYNMLVFFVDMLISCGFFIFLIYLLLQPGQSQRNQYGEQ